MENKSLKKNYIYNLIYQFLIIILPLITTPYLSRVLGAEKVGIYGFTISITTYFLLFGTLGLSLYGQREIAYVQNDIEKRSKVFFELVIIRTISVLISMTIFFMLFCLEGEYSVYYRILLLEILSIIFDISWFFQGLEDFKKTVIRNLFVKITSIILIFILVKRPEDLYIYFIIYVLSTFIGNISLWFYLPKFINKIRLKELNLKRHIKPALLLFVPQIATQVYIVLDKTMIGILVVDKAEVGFYEQAQKIVKLCVMLSTSLGAVMLPRMAATYAKREYDKLINYLKKSLSMTMMIAFPLFIGISTISYRFVPIFFGKGYDRVIPIICLMSPIIIFIGLSNVTGTQFLLPTKQTSKYTISVVIGAITNVAFNLILIPRLGAIGATIATIIAELSVTTVQFIMIKKYLSLKAIYLLTYHYLIASIPIMISGLILKSIILNNYLYIIIQILVSAFIYIVLMIILKDDMFSYVVNNIFNKLNQKVVSKKKEV